MSDAAIDATAGPLIVFQLPGDDRLRGVTWDGLRSGVLGGRATLATWTQSPDGSRYAIGGIVYAADGEPSGTVPWDAGAGTFSWSARGDILCEALADPPGTTGATLRLEIAAAGQRPRTVASSFGTYGDNSTYPILACDPQSDRAIVAALGQGVFAGHVFVFRLSTGELLHQIDTPRSVAGAWATASSDGTLIAYSMQATASSGSTTTIRRADDGTALATLAHFEAHGFSGDGVLIYGVRTDTPTFEVREWRTGKTIWMAAGYHYAGYLAEPARDRLAVEVGRDNALADADVYIVSPSGVVSLLPHGVKTSFRY